MKYLIPILFFITACSHPKPQNKTFICFNPLSVIQSVEINTADEKVKETISHLIVTTSNGSVVTFPKSLCVEAKSAEENK